LRKWSRLDSEAGDAAEDVVVDVADQLGLQLLDAVLEPLLHLVVAVEQVVPDLVEQEAGALGVALEVAAVGAAHRREELGLPAVHRQQQVLEDDHVDALELEAGAAHAAGGQRQVQAVLVAHELRGGAVALRALDDLGGTAQVAQRLPGAVVAMHADVQPRRTCRP
jgi:hypothetical protein